MYKYLLVSFCFLLLSCSSTTNPIELIIKKREPQLKPVYKNKENHNLQILYTKVVRDSLGMIADTFVDPFAHVTWRENELFGASGNQIDYISVKGATAVDFRADNEVNFDSLEKNSIDLYASYKSLYLQNRENKINNSSESENDWGNLDN